mmetsp:Transcript_14652/g.27543  ORF Transcript_14652/g.27543 Transcript_14652/m.27543 type:complete len:239 (+) Transcript_14652:512-1228(+)
MKFSISSHADGLHTSLWFSHKSFQSFGVSGSEEIAFITTSSWASLRSINMKTSCISTSISSLPVTVTVGLSASSALFCSSSKARCWDLSLLSKTWGLSRLMRLLGGLASLSLLLSDWDTLSSSLSPCRLGAKLPSEFSSGSSSELSSLLLLSLYTAMGLDSKNLSMSSPSLQSFTPAVVELSSLMRARLEGNSNSSMLTASYNWLPCHSFQTTFLVGTMRLVPGTYTIYVSLECLSPP